MALSQVGEIPVTNPFFFRHLTEIAPGKTVVVSFTRQDPGLSALQCPALEVERKKTHFPLKLTHVKWGWNLIVHGYHEVFRRRDIQKIAEFLSEHHVKAVLAEDGHNGCAMLPSCLKAGIPLYTHFHGADVGVGSRRWEVRASYTYLAKYGTGFITSSYYLAEKLKELGFPEEKIHAVHCGVKTQDFVPSDEKDDHLIVAIGRFIPKKAPQRTLEAFAEVLAEYPEAMLEMIGNGPLLEKSIQKAQTLGIQKNVIFNFENRSNHYVQERLKHAAVFCQHSVTAPYGDTESFGITLVEAMACEIPVVATRHNGFVETVVDGVTGFLTPEHDVHAMAAAIKRLLADPELRKKMGKAGRQRVLEKFTAEQNIEKLRTLLLE